MSIQLSPSLKTAVGVFAAQTLDLPKGTRAQDARPLLGSISAQNVDVQELSSVAQKVAAQLGRANVEQLADVTRNDCLKCSSDPLDGIVLWALVLAVQVHLTGCDDKKTKLPKRADPLPELDVTAIMGAYEDPVAPRRVDPLVLTFGKVERGTPDKPTKLLLYNRSRLDDSKPIELPGDTAKAVDGRYSIVFGDDWIREQGLKAGNILELVQVRGERRSPGTVVAVNPAGPGVQPSPQLPPGDVVGDVTKRTMFRRDLDPVPTKVRPELIDVKLADSKLRLSSTTGLAFEPFTKLALENLRTGEKANASVAKDGKFTLDVPAEKGDAIVLCAVDHSHGLDDPMFERRLSFVAGRDETPILGANPAIAIDSPPRLALGRLELHHGSEHLRSQGGITPGTVLTIYRASHPSERSRTVADANGSIDLPLPFTPYADDVLVVEGKNPFGIKGAPAEWQKLAGFRAELEIKESGSLIPITREGDVRDAACSVQKPLGADTLDGAEPDRSARFEIESASMSFSTYDWRTGNSAGVRGRTDLVHDQATAAVNFDAAKDEIVIRIAAQKGGGWRSESLGDVGSASTYFEQVGRGSWTDQNSAVPILRKQLFARGEGSSIAVRFEDSEGRAQARGFMKIYSKILPHNTGAFDKNHAVWFADLDPATLTKSC